jgi:2-oxo-4-hydroxy-4-carboxy-5-ureidoimidazoline decarboxylase
MRGGGSPVAELSAFNALSRDEATEALYACLGVRRWAREVEAGRPYAGWPALQATAESAAAELSDDELEEALAGHPRIGERPGAGHAAEHSQNEQAGVDTGDREVMTALAARNAAYEQRFGRVFLIRAAGRSAEEILGELDHRLGRSDEEERAEAVAQLREIALLRLQELRS